MKVNLTLAEPALLQFRCVNSTIHSYGIKIYIILVNSAKWVNIMLKSHFYCYHSWEEGRIHRLFLFLLEYRFSTYKFTNMPFKWMSCVDEFQSNNNTNLYVHNHSVIIFTHFRLRKSSMQTFRQYECMVEFRHLNFNSPHCWYSNLQFTQSHTNHAWSNSYLCKQFFQLFRY